MKKTAVTRADQVLAILKAREKGKTYYARADAMLEALLADMTPGEVVELPGSRTATLIDQFAQKNKIFKPCGINRYDLKVAAA